MKYLSISAVIPTYNSQKTLYACLKSIRNQNYPQDKIEIILSDGGSNDATPDIAGKYRARFLSVNNPDKQGPEYNRAFGSHQAKGEILLFADHDNILPHENWITKMVKPFIDDKKTVGVETIRYAYNRSDPVLSRFFSLFAVNDILPFYLGKADRLSYIYDNLSQYGTFKKAKVNDQGGYYTVDFNKDYIPTLGSNGFMVRKKTLFDNADIRPDYFFHIDVNVDLIQKGFNRYAFIKDELIHDTHERGVFDYFRRRKLFMERYGLDDLSNRRYSVYEEKDLKNLILFVLAGLTVIRPLWDSAKGYIKIRDPAWFLNPVMCFATVVLYGLSMLKHMWKKYV